MTTATARPIRLGPITVTFLVEADASGGSVTVFRCDVTAGNGMPVPHSHDAFDETIYGLDGTVTLTVDGVDVPVGPGEAYCIVRGAVHSFLACDGDVAFLAVASPGVFGAAYFLELADVLREAAGGPPDPQAVAAVMLRHGLTPAKHPVP